MKILLATGIYPPEIGGPASYTHGLAHELRSRGFDVTVLAYGDTGGSASDMWPVIRVSRSGGPMMRYLRYAWRTFLLARHSDVVYAQGPVSEGLPVTIGAWMAGTPVVMKVVGDYAWEMAQQRGETALLDVFLKSRHGGMIGFYEWAERRTARHAARMIVPSEYLKTVVATWGVPHEKIDVVINAVDPLPATKGRAAERDAFGLSAHVVILSVARAVPWKGIAELTEWWTALPASHMLVVAGDGPELSDWKALAATNGVADRIRFLGRVDRATLSRWYDAADAFALHSGYEGWPHVVSEAVSKGIPCFVSDQGGNPETKRMFQDFVTVLPYLDRDAWISALRNVTIRHESAGRTPWTHAQMVDATVEILKTYARR